MDMVAPELIDGSFVPCRSDVASVEVDGETVVAGGPTHAFYRLDPLASLVWSCLDGTGTTAEIAGDMAAEFGAAADVVERDVVALARTLGRLCFLEGVDCPDAAVPPTATTTVPSVGRHLVEPPSG